MAGKTKTILSRGLALSLGITGGILREIGSLRHSPGEPIEIPQRGIRIPAAPIFSLQPSMCAQYARLAAQELFGLEYSKSNAWDRIYEDELITEVEGPLVNYIERQFLVPGNIVGVFNPRSVHNFRKDRKGRPVRYTHNALYLGAGDINGDGETGDSEIFFAHQFGPVIRRTSLEELTRKGLFIRDIFRPKELAVQSTGEIL